MKAKSSKRKARPVHRKKSPVDPSAQESAQKLDAYFRAYFAGPKERVEHDLSIEHVTNDNYWSAKKFIHACEKVGVWRLKQGELTNDAGLHLAHLAWEIAESIRVLIGQGDLLLARQLPPVVEVLQDTLKVYGSKVTGRVTKRLSIEQLLKKYKARELLAMLSALHPDWHCLLLHIYHPKIQKLPEKRLRELILSKERFIGWKNGKRTEEYRKHGLAEILENVFAVREGENENINLFVEHLWQGRLWSLGDDKSGSKPGKTYVTADWPGLKDLPARDNVRAWMEIVMPFLRRITQDDAMRLSVFEHLIAMRKAVYVREKDSDRRLADDKTDYIWNQVRTRIAQAWKTMASRASKRNSGKTA
jgi:hypothetical protein